MKLFKRGKHAYKHTPYKRGKHAQGSTTIISKSTFEHTLQNNKSKLIFGKSGIGKASSVIEFSLTTEIPEDITGIPFFDEQNQADPEMLNPLYELYEIIHGKEV